MCRVVIDGEKTASIERREGEGERERGNWLVDLKGFFVGTVIATTFFNILEV